jgi:2'-5' RNA ligase
MRLFFALPLPLVVRQELAALRRELGKDRWVPAAQLHVTLRFLGEVDDAQAARVIEAVQEERERAPWAMPALSVRGMGTFGGRKPRVLFARLTPPAPVETIAADLERAVVRAGIAPEARAFSAHITLARLARPDLARVEAFLRDEASFESAPFDVEEVILYRSTLTPSGAVHEPLQRFAIAG